MRAVILDGIVLGLGFGLLGVGMTLVYGLGGVINLAYGQIVVLGAIVASLVMGGLLTWRYPAGALYINISGEPISIVGVPMAVGSVWASVIALAVGALLLL